MKTKILFSTIVVIILAFVIGTISVISFPSGAPAGHTGSPADKKVCSQCHKTPAVEKENWITSNIESLGYKPGATYTITATATGPAEAEKFGFQVSPQNITGDLLGTLVVSNENETHLVGGGKYITHKKAGISGKGSKSWTFNWIAPKLGTGEVTFYGAFVTNPKPFTVVTSKLIVKEAK